MKTNKLLTTKQSADYVEIDNIKFKNFRSHGDGPKLAKTEKNQCYYDKKELDKWKKKMGDRLFKRRAYSKAVVVLQPKKLSFLSLIILKLKTLMRKRNETTR